MSKPTAAMISFIYLEFARHLSLRGAETPHIPGKLYVQVKGAGEIVQTGKQKGGDLLCTIIAGYSVAMTGVGGE